MRLFNKLRISTILVPVACSLLLLSSSAMAELPQISDARVIQPPPGANVAAAYFTVTNPGKDALTITGVTTSAAKKAELHLSKVENDVAKMIRQDQLTIDAGESLKFMHGSYHVMLMGLSNPLESGATLELLLQTSAGELPVSVPVISPDEADAMSHGSDEKMAPMKHDIKTKHGTDTN